MSSAWSLRKNKRGNAGFAIIAVALLLLGGAAALYLHGVDRAASDARDAESAEQAALQTAASREVSTLAALAQGALFQSLGGLLAPGPGNLAEVSAETQSRLATRIDALYPRTAAGGAVIDAELLFARAVPLEAEADLASPYGGRPNVSVPAFVGVEGVVKITTTGRFTNATTSAGFSSRFPLPTLLPASIASRVAFEASPGGRVERVLGQLATDSMLQNRSAMLEPSWARELVSLALGLESAMHFGSSGNASVDARIAEGTEGAAPGPLPTTFNVTGIAGPVGLHVRQIATDNLSVSPSWTYFDGGEVSHSVLAAMRIEASGSLQITVGVTTSVGSADVGPIAIPVALKARAFAADVPDEAIVSSGELARAVAEVEANGTRSLYGLALALAGFPVDGNGSITVNASATAAIAHSLAASKRESLPPLEDVEEFARANEPARLDPQRGTIALDVGEPIEPVRALLRVDGADVGFYPASNGSFSVPRIPKGLHAVEAAFDFNGTHFAGGAELLVGASAWNVTVPMAPRQESTFLKAALSRGEALSQPAGLIVLAEAGSLVGLAPPFNLTTVAEAAEYARLALERLEALQLAGVGDAAAAGRTEDAADFAGIMFGLLKAADAANKALKPDPLPVGGLAGSVGALVLSPEPQSFLKVTIQAVTLAEAVADAKSVTLSVPTGGEVLTRKLPTAKMLLVLDAVASALSLAADFVKIERAFSNNTTADDTDRVIVLANTAVHLADITLAVAEAVFRLTSAALYKGLEHAFLTLGAAVTAAAIILDLAALYHETGGNFSAMWQELVAPKGVGGLMRLPSIVGGAAAAVVDLLYVAGAIGFKGGPIGIAASLFVLAALIVANKEQVASAIHGTLDYDALKEIRTQVGEAIGVGFAGSAAANSLDLIRATQARRAASAHAAREWLASATASDRPANASAASRFVSAGVRASGLGDLMDASLRLRFAARALVEQADDFASPPYDVAPGRRTEGYRAYQTLAGSYNFSGDVRVNSTTRDGENYTLSRESWRALLENAKDDGLSSYRFAFSLTDTNGIKVEEYARWTARLSAAGEEFTLCAAAYRIAANALA